MSAMMTIGDFSRATRLSAKALRFYHQVGLLEPAAVDPLNHYRLYDVEQIEEARLVKHLRSLDMPVDEIRLIMVSQNAKTRNSAIAYHLGRMEERLRETQRAVKTLRELLPETPTSVEIRSYASTEVVIVRDTIDLDALSTWFATTRKTLLEETTRTGLATVGPLGGLWSTELFLEERGDCALFFPIEGTAQRPLRANVVHESLPASLMAVAVHRGSDDTIEAAYATLGEYVAGLGRSAPGPLRESYAGGAPLTHGTTEIGWPLT